MALNEPVVTQLIKAISQGKQLSPKNIGNLCYGLAGLDGKSGTTKALVNALTRKIQDSDATLDAQAIANACFGLKNLDGSHDSTKALVHALATKVLASRAQLKAQAIGNACYGLQQLDGSHASTQPWLTP